MNGIAKAAAAGFYSHFKAKDEIAGARVAEHQLRMLGVPAARAKRVAWRELAPLSLDED